MGDWEGRALGRLMLTEYDLISIARLGVYAHLGSSSLATY